MTRPEDDDGLTCTEPVCHPDYTGGFCCGRGGLPALPEEYVNGNVEMHIAHETPLGTQFPGLYGFLVTQPDIPEETWPEGSIVLVAGVLWRKILPCPGFSRWVTETLGNDGEYLPASETLAELAKGFAPAPMYYLKLRHDMPSIV